MYMSSNPFVPEVSSRGSTLFLFVFYPSKPSIFLMLIQNSESTRVMTQNVIVIKRPKIGVDLMRVGFISYEYVPPTLTMNQKGIYVIL